MSAILTVSRAKLNPGKFREYPAQPNCAITPCQFVPARRHPQRFAGHRMRQLQMAGVQHQARAAEMLRHTAVLPQIAVLAVADDRMAKMRHVAPQLVLAAGFRLQLHQL